MESNKICRLTLFKLQDLKKDGPQLLQMYSLLKDKAIKKSSSKPYIEAIQALPLIDNPRSNQYNFMGIVTFKNREDMDYYDRECEAHAAIKEFLLSDNRMIDKATALFGEWGQGFGFLPAEPAPSS